MSKNYVDYLEDDDLYYKWLHEALNHSNINKLLSKGIIELNDINVKEDGSIEDVFGDWKSNLKTISFLEFLQKEGYELLTN
jgi:hypothetical protein